MAHSKDIDGLSPILQQNPGSSVGPSDHDDQRKQQVLADHLAYAFQNPNPVQAAVGVVNNGLMAMAIRYGTALDQAMQSMAGSLASLQQLRPHWDLFLRCTRQIHLLADLESRPTKEAKNRDFDTHKPVAADAIGSSSPTGVVGTSTTAAPQSDPLPDAAKASAGAGLWPAELDEDDDNSDLYEDE